MAQKKVAKKKTTKKKTTKKTARSRSAGRESTDLEAHVSARGRAEQVRRVREKIKELGITYIYYQFISVTGRIVGKGIPADHCCLLYTSPSPRDGLLSRMPTSA